MNLFKTTKNHSDWWACRKIDWNAHYLATWNHPHRFMLTAVLQSVPWISLVEVGCGAGANLMNILKHTKGKQVGGIDINEDAIELCKKTFLNGFFKVGSADDVMMSDKSVDVVLSDMTLIYVDRFHITKHLQEFKRLARNSIVLCEFDSKSWWKRLKILLKTGYNTYDYERLLKKIGCFDIQKYPIPQEVWEDKNKVRTIIVAKVPRRN